MGGHGGFATPAAQCAAKLFVLLLALAGFGGAGLAAGFSSDPYKVLGVSRGVDAAALKRAYKKLALKYHPDKNPAGHAKFVEIQHAYEVLSGRANRRPAYDEGDGGGQHQGGSHQRDSRSSNDEKRRRQEQDRQREQEQERQRERDLQRQQERQRQQEQQQREQQRREQERREREREQGWRSEQERERERGRQGEQQRRREQESQRQQKERQEEWERQYQLWAERARAAGNKLFSLACALCAAIAAGFRQLHDTVVAWLRDKALPWLHDTAIPWLLHTGIPAVRAGATKVLRELTSAALWLMCKALFAVALGIDRLLSSLRCGEEPWR